MESPGSTRRFSNHCGRRGGCSQGSDTMMSVGSTMGRRGASIYGVYGVGIPGGLERMMRFLNGPHAGGFRGFGGPTDDLYEDSFRNGGSDEVPSSPNDPSTRNFQEQQENDENALNGNEYRNGPEGKHHFGYAQNYGGAPNHGYDANEFNGNGYRNGPEGKHNFEDAHNLEETTKVHPNTETSGTRKVSIMVISWEERADLKVHININSNRSTDKRFDQAATYQHHHQIDQ
ncbi:hypothetical protein JTB14_006043 [Gonioctena quinquepunctata]|nr:hypothetical protein JTB14_006043 [Gonioctena quinquepunctata]